jgi:hypothetical protein
MSADELRSLLSSALASPEACVAVARGLVPTAERLDAALHPAATQARLDLAAAYTKWFPPADAPDRAWLKVLDVPRARTDVRVFGATGDQIAARTPGTAAASEFPGGAADIAAVLRPDLTYFEATFTEPGASAGTRLHMFCKIDDGFCMLGPIWRALRA